MEKCGYGTADAVLDVLLRKTASHIVMPKDTEQLTFAFGDRFGSGKHIPTMRLQYRM